MEAAQVEAFLARHSRGLATDVTRLAAGEWSTAYAFSAQGQARVIRFSRFAEDFAKDRVAAGLAATGLLVPRVLEIGEALDGYFAISERARGRPLDSLSGAEMRTLLPSLFTTLDAVRRADIGATSGFGRWDATGVALSHSWSAFLLDVANGPAPTGRIAGWRERLAKSRTGTRPFDQAAERLEALADGLPHVRSLVHADLLNGNVLASDGKIGAVLDWGNAMYGDFLYDVAWFEFWSPWYPQWGDIDFAAEAQRHFETTALDVPHFAPRLSACLIHIGLDGQAYSAFKGRWADLDETARRTLAFAETK